MTESILCDLHNSNGLETDFNSLLLEGEVSQNKSSSRPSAIPRLMSCTSQRNDHSFPTEERHNKSKIPVSPSKINHQRPKSIGCYTKSPSQDSHMRSLIISPTYCKRSSRDVFNFSHCTNTEPRQRVTAQSLNRYDRAFSEENQGRKSIESSYSELTNNSGSAGGPNYVITSKIGSLTNARHKPGGGNVKIFEDKIDFSNVEARCGSKKNIKHKPGGGDFEIVNRKVEFSKTAESKVNSLKNINHKPLGGDVKIDNRKLEWNTNSKVGSLNNVKHKPGGGDIQIINQSLPWLKYNKPNLPPEEIAKINKKPYNSKEVTGSSPKSNSNSQSSDQS